jgi:hypothetical protein
MLTEGPKRLPIDQNTRCRLKGTFKLSDDGLGGADKEHGMPTLVAALDALIQIKGHQGDA